MAAEKSSTPAALPGEDLVRVDRSRLTHKQSKRMTVLTVEMRKAEQELDAERMDALLEEVDAIASSVIVEVPPGWLPQGVTVESKGWMDHLTQDRYQRLMQLAAPQEPGAPKA